MHDVAVAFLWHQHQPYYPDDLSGENPMPWVRLHGTKDYWGMAMHLKEVPEMRATINLVPSLVEQLLAYTDGGRDDMHLRVSRRAADDLSQAELVYLMDNFFMVHPEQMIRPWPRYLELYQKRGLSVDGALRAAKRYSKRDLIDLQVWNNLAWIHPLAFECDTELAAFRDQGRNWSEGEKQWLLDKQLELLREVIPLHKELAARGQVELTTTPFFHPIMPLLWDKRLARQAMPHVDLPRHLEQYQEDVARHLQRAVSFHEQVFGVKPVGMWPSEGSVAQAIVPAIAAAGIRWIATDEEILACSTNGWVARDGHGYLRHPEMLYRPWRVEEKGRTLEIVFRDHAMSDQIGFHYQRYAPQHAVDDLVGKLEAIGNATGGNAGHRPTLVSIILDGENCWEYYPNGGVDFLRKLYQRLVEHPRITPVRVRDYLESHPATDKLGHLFAGSWIGHNFGIWIGHPECNRAWDLLHETRVYLKAVQTAGTKPCEQLAIAERELDIAEGSDWFWWFGDDHSSAQDALFDRLFRQHLQNVYMVLGDTPPPELAKPISQAAHGARRWHTDPTGLLRVKVDGRRTYFEWINAGHAVCGKSRGAMAMSAEGLLAHLYFGFDTDRLLVRLDMHDGTARERMNAIDAIRVTFVQPSGFELLVSRPSWQEPILQLYHRDVPVAESGLEAAGDQIFELAVPFRSLAAATDDAVQFFIELLKDEQAVERAPNEGLIETTVPSADFEMIMWQA